MYRALWLIGKGALLEDPCTSGYFEKQIESLLSDLHVLQAKSNKILDFYPKVEVDIESLIWDSQKFQQNKLKKLSGLPISTVII